jgi:hypothetical protein
MLLLVGWLGKEERRLVGLRFNLMCVCVCCVKGVGGVAGVMARFEN